MLNKTVLRERFVRNEAVCGKVIGLFALVANKIRFRILCLLSKGDFCVNDIQDVISCGTLSNVSQQLKLLTLAELIDRKRSSKHVIYTITDKRVKKLIQFLEKEYLQTQEV